jgi:hypothetical protein
MSGPLGFDWTIVPLCRVVIRRSCMAIRVEGLRWRKARLAIRHIDWEFIVSESLFEMLLELEL